MCNGKKAMLKLGVSALVTMVLGFSPNTHAQPSFDPFAVGSPFEGCKAPVRDQQDCEASAPIATAAMAELAVCMANVRAGFPLPPPPPHFQAALDPWLSKLRRNTI